MNTNGAGGRVGVSHEGVAAGGGTERDVVGRFAKWSFQSKNHQILERAKRSTGEPSGAPGLSTDLGRLRG